MTVPALSPAEAAPPVLCQPGPLSSGRILGCWSEFREGSKAGEGSGTQILPGAAEGAGGAQPGEEEEAQGRPHHSP